MWLDDKTFSDPPDSKMDGHKGLSLPSNHFGWSQKTFHLHLDTEIDIETDLDCKLYFTHVSTWFLSIG